MYRVLTLWTEVSLVTFGALAFVFTNAFTSISTGLWAFAWNRRMQISKELCSPFRGNYIFSKESQGFERIKAFKWQLFPLISDQPWLCYCLSFVLGTNRLIFYNFGYESSTMSIVQMLYLYHFFDKQCFIWFIKTCNSRYIESEDMDSPLSDLSSEFWFLYVTISESRPIPGHDDFCLSLGFSRNQDLPAEFIQGSDPWDEE